MCIFLGDDFWIYFRAQRFLVRQWIHVSSSLRRPCTRILRPIFVLLSFVSVFNTMLGPQWYMFCVSLRIGSISGFST